MKTHRHKPEYLGLGIFSAAILIMSSCGVYAEYRAPDMNKELFATQEIQLDKFSKAGLVGALVSVARDYNEQDHKVSLDTRSYALAIAGRLDKDSQKVQECLRQLHTEWKTIPQATAKKEVTSDRLYSSIRSLMRRKDNKANQTCAAYCIDIAITFKPQASRLEKLIEHKASLAQDGYVANWSGLLKTPAPKGISVQKPKAPTSKTAPLVMSGGNAKNLASLEARIHGIYHDNPYQFIDKKKKVTPITITAVKDTNQEGLFFQFNHPAGSLVTQSLQSSIKFVEGLYSEDTRPSGYKITISANRSGGPRNNFKQGIAFALAIDSMLTGDEIDEQFTCIGRINLQGKSNLVRGIPRSIQDAINKDHKIMGVPHINRKEVYDFFLLQGMGQLLKINIFSLKDFTEAKKIALKQKDSDIQEAISLYTDLGNLIRKMGPDILKQPEAKNKLRSILNKAPNHICAQILLDIGNNKMKKYLSARGSMEEIDFHREIYNSNIHDSRIKKYASEYIDYLNKIRHLIDPRCMAYYKAALTFQKPIAAGSKKGESNIEFSKRIDRSYGKVTNERKKIFANPKTKADLQS